MDTSGSEIPGLDEGKAVKSGTPPSRPEKKAKANHRRDRRRSAHSRQHIRPPEIGPPPPPPRILSQKWDGRDTFEVPEAGQILGLSRAASYIAAANGDLPTIRIGKRLIVPRIALERLLTSAGQPA
jgi:hypothetical protein